MFSSLQEKIPTIQAFKIDKEILNSKLVHWHDLTHVFSTLFHQNRKLLSNILCSTILLSVLFFVRFLYWTFSGFELFIVSEFVRIINEYGDNNSNQSKLFICWLKCILLAGRQMLFWFDFVFFFLSFIPFRIDCYESYDHQLFFN